MLKISTCYFFQHIFEPTSRPIASFQVDLPLESIFFTFQTLAFAAFGFSVPIFVLVRKYIIHLTARLRSGKFYYGSAIMYTIEFANGAYRSDHICMHSLPYSVCINKLRAFIWRKIYSCSTWHFPRRKSICFIQIEPM